MQTIKDKLRDLQKSNGPSREICKNINSNVDLSKLELLAVSNKYGSFLMREKRFPLDFVHGGQVIADYLALTYKELMYINKKEISSDIHPADFVFFDTETTGLAGGSGTYIFLAGFGYFEKECFVVKQFVLTEYKNEYAYLQQILETFEKFRGIISFNGKSYDLPLLQSRYILNKMKVDFDNFVHIDLLYTSRRLWNKSIKSCSLSNIEKNILGFSRRDDITGADVPQKFFSFLQTGDVELLLPVLKHNSIDIITMLSLTISSGRAFDFSNKRKAWVDANETALFKIFTFLGEHNAVFSMMRSPFKDMDANLLMEYSYFMKRLGNTEEAAKVWEHLISRSIFIERAYLELAKYNEYKRCDYSKALEIVQRVLKRHEFREAVGSETEKIAYEDWVQRKKRLTRKAAVKN